MEIQREDDSPRSVDVYVGGRMRLRRIQLGLSQSALAKKTGVSFQAVQKYESGSIRISASRLYEVSQVLEVAPDFFFDGYPDGATIQNLTRGIPPEIATADPREIRSLVRAFYGIGDEHLRAEILRLVSRIANQGSSGNVPHTDN